MHLGANVLVRKDDYMSYVNSKGVDISHWNGDVDFEKLKRNGFTFVMIGMGKMFDENVAKAEKAGFPWGAYFYVTSVSPEEDVEELNKILSRLAGKKPLFPIAIDVEHDDDRENRGGWTYQNVNRNAKFLLEGIANAGYYPMLYTGFEEIENYISPAVYEKYDMWFAHWASKCGYNGSNLSIWQYGGEVNLIRSPYIEGDIFDQDICYKDYPTIIQNGGYNNWGTKPVVKKPIEMLAFEVLDGLWSEGNERKRLLENAGYDYKAVQRRVNEIVASWDKPVLDKKGYKFKDSNIGILAVKEALIYSKKLGIITQNVQENKGFGDGTLIAVNQILKLGGYNQNGIIGENFIKYLSKLIKDKLGK